MTQQASEPRSVPCIYFFDLRGDGRFVRIGFDGSTRIKQHKSMLQKLLAAMPGTKDFEGRLHKHFSPHLTSEGDGQRSIYEGEEIWTYVEWLVRRGIATNDPQSIPHLPVVPWDVMNPKRVDPYWNDGDQRSLFKPGPHERIEGAAKAAYHQSLSDEWYTPAEILESARLVLGTIDLDPASCPKANQLVGAKYFYSQQVDGLDLDHPWFGRIWMNPPYGGLAEKFAERLGRELSTGAVSEAIALFNQNSMTSKWFASVYSIGRAYLITHGRLEFTPGDPSQPFSSPSTGSVVVYCGQNVDRFCNEFRKHGQILLPEVCHEDL